MIFITSKLTGFGKKKKNNWIKSPIQSLNFDQLLQELNFPIKLLLINKRWGRYRYNRVHTDRLGNKPCVILNLGNFSLTAVTIAYQALMETKAVNL